MSNQKEYDCFRETDKHCVNSPTGYCKHRGHLDRCVHQQGCIVPERPDFERKIIKK